MIVLAVAALMIGIAALCLVAGYAMGRAEEHDALQWEVNLWRKRVEQLEHARHVRRIPVVEPGSR